MIDLSFLTALHTRMHEIAIDLQTPEPNKWTTVARMSMVHNPWFTAPSVLHAVQGLAHMLQSNYTKPWLSQYDIVVPALPKRVGIIMAGNIPMVGFHDLLCVLLSGHTAVVKLSQQDTVLIKALIEEMIALHPTLSKQIEITERLDNIDAVIATGSNNAATHFHYYFGKYPHIIRKNRNSVAIIDGNENTTDMEKLGSDIFTYFGLGCRNVSKMFVPSGYDFHNFFSPLITYSEVAMHNKYVNNYEYYRAIFLLNSQPFLTNDFLIIKEDKTLATPVAILNYEYYNDSEHLQQLINEQLSGIQCIVGNKTINGTIPFGTSQMPGIGDYADGADTLQFLLSL